MRIAYSPRVDSAADAVAELPDLAQSLFEGLERYAVRAEPSWRPDVLAVSAAVTRISPPRPSPKHGAAAGLLSIGCPPMAASASRSQDSQPLIDSKESTHDIR